MILGVFFRFYHLDRKVFWEDEIIGTIHMFGYTEAEIVTAAPHLTSAGQVRQYIEPPANGRLGISATVRSLALEDPQHPPAYYVAERLWVRLFGSSVAAMRSLPALFGVLALPLVYLLARELFDSTETALLAVALVAVSPFFVLYAQEAREYSMWTAAVALDAWLFLRAIRIATPAWWVAYAVCTGFSLYVYPLTGLVALGLCAYLFVRERGRPSGTLTACVLANLGALAIFAPWLWVIKNATPVIKRGLATILTSKLSALEIARIFARDLRFLFFDLGPVHVGPLGQGKLDALFTLLVVALSLCAIGALIREQPFAVWGFIVIGLCLSMTPLLLRDLLVRGHFVYQARYFIPLLLGVELSVAALFGMTVFGRASRSPARPVWSALLILVVGGSVLSCVTIAQATTWWNKDSEQSPEVAAIINHASRPLVVSDYFTPSIVALSLYLDPRVPVRLNVKCVQCDLPYTARPGLTDDTGYDNVFALQTPAANGPHYRWVDPLPYPPQPDPLDMFVSIPSEHAP